MLVRMFLPGGKPEGLRTLELSNSTVLGTVVPRQLVAEFAKRRESSRPGVYLLFGPAENAPDVMKTYVGEGDPVIERIRSHDVRKDF